MEKTAVIAMNYLKFQTKMLKEMYGKKYKSVFNMPEKDRKTFFKKVKEEWSKQKA